MSVEFVEFVNALAECYKKPYFIAGISLSQQIPDLQQPEPICFMDNDDDVADLYYITYEEGEMVSEFFGLGSGETYPINGPLIEKFIGYHSI